MEGCEYPNCPTHQNMTLLNERHEEIKTSLFRIESNQSEMIMIGRSVSSLTADVDNIKEANKINTKEHDEVFTRLRKVEFKGVWLTGAMAAAITVFEVLKAMGVFK
jgi:hypothetical protein